MKKLKKFFRRRMTCQMPMADIAYLTNTPLWHVTRAVTKLEKKGVIYVERNHGKSNRYHYNYRKEK